MIEFYPAILTAHIAAVSLSGLLFALRGAAVLAGVRQAMSAPVRYLTYAVDTVLLSAALMLVTLLPAEVFTNHWLTVKLVLVGVYVVLGILALRRGHTRRTRTLSYVLALLVFCTIVGIARAHSPLGWLATIDTNMNGVRAAALAGSPVTASA